MIPTQATCCSALTLRVSLRKDFWLVNLSHFTRRNIQSIYKSHIKVKEPNLTQDSGLNFVIEVLL